VVEGGSHDQEGEESNTDRGQILSTIQLPQPDEPGSVQAYGSVNNQERRGIDVDGGEDEQTHLHLHSSVEISEGSGPAERKDIGGEKVEQVDPSSFTTSIPHDAKPDSA